MSDQEKVALAELTEGDTFEEIKKLRDEQHLISAQVGYYI
jgi:hypothetical protein